MSYGALIKIGNKQVYIDTWGVYNIIDSFYLSEGAGSGHKTYDVPAYRSVEAFCYNRSSSGGGAYSCSVSGNTVYWEMENSGSSADIIVFGVD